MNQPILEVLSGTMKTPPPIWMMRQAGRHLPEYMKIRATAKDFIDFCFSPDKAAEVTLQPIRRYDMDAAILFADILLVPIALGRSVTFEKGVGPILNPISPEDILSMPRDMSVLEPVYETVSRVRSELSKDKTLIGFCGGPWTVATYMIEGRGSPQKQKAKHFAYVNSDAMDQLLSDLADASADYMIGQAKAGADVLKIFESWAEGLAPAMFDRLVIKPTQQMIKKIREAGITVPIIGFPRGAGLNAVRYAHKVKVQACAAGTDMPLNEFRGLIPAHMATQGNLDPLALRIGGDVLKSAVGQVLSTMSGPHIFNLGHGVAPDVKIENVQAVIAHVRGGDPKYV